MAQVIAELERSHRGDLDLAARMIAEAKRCGADYAKIQAYQTKFLRPGDPAEAALKEAELDEKGIRFLARVCKDEGIKFLATVFDPERVPLIRELSDEVKIGSGEAEDGEIVPAVYMAGFKKVFLGSGMFPFAVTPSDAFVIRMASVSKYPASLWECAAAIGRVVRIGNLWGYSDHCIGHEACLFALACGARAIEVHVALANIAPRAAYEKPAVELKNICVMARDSHPHRDLDIAEAAAKARYLYRWSHGR